MMSAMGSFDLDPYREQLDELVAAARDFGHRGWTPATSGNYSVRLGADHLAITRSGVEKRHLTMDGLMVVDLEARPVAGGRPSAETLLHTQIYRRHPDVGAILHVHSPASTVASRLLVGQEGIRLTNYELLKAFEGTTTHDIEMVVPVLPNRQNIPELCDLAAPWLEDAGRYCYLIEGHGVYTWGSHVQMAARHMEAIDFLLQCHLEERRLR